MEQTISIYDVEPGRYITNIDVSLGYKFDIGKRFKFLRVMNGILYLESDSGKIFNSEVRGCTKGWAHYIDPKDLYEDTNECDSECDSECDNEGDNNTEVNIDDLKIKRRQLK